MHPQLETVVREFGEAGQRMARLNAVVPDGWWGRRADPARWSIAECVAHLNLTAENFLPRIERGLSEARALGRPAPRRYRRDPVGWLLWRTAGPPVRLRVPTAAAFVPRGSTSAPELLQQFETLQRAQIDAVRRADGLPLGEVRITSPVDPRLRYNLYALLTVLPRHQHRHLWQAERVLERLQNAR